jgi:hydrogenase maturation protease
MEMSRQFFASGDVYPRGWPAGPSQLRAECLIEGSDPSIELTARFAQVVERQIFDATGTPVPELVVTGRRYECGKETAEREVTLAELPDRTAAIRTAGSAQAELTEQGRPAGTVVWRWEPMHSTVEAWTEELAPGLHRVQVDVANRLEWLGDQPELALLQTLRSTHVVMHSPDGAFVSLAHPPAHLRSQAAACHNEGLWPVPIGEAGDRRTILASPVVLEDYPPLSVVA